MRPATPRLPGHSPPANGGPGPRFHDRGSFLVIWTCLFLTPGVSWSGLFTYRVFRRVRPCSGHGEGDPGCGGVCAQVLGGAQADAGRRGGGRQRGGGLGQERGGGVRVVAWLTVVRSTPSRAPVRWTGRRRWSRRRTASTWSSVSIRRLPLEPAPFRMALTRRPPRRT